MKKYLLVFLFFCAALSLQAQNNKVPSAEEIAKKTTDTLERRLSLNSTQKSIVFSYNLELTKVQEKMYKKQMAGTYNEDDATVFLRKDNETTRKIKSILKPEQIALFNKYKEEIQSGVLGKKKKKGEENGDDDLSGLLSFPPPKSQQDL